MEEFGAIWHQESMDDLNFKLQYATLELESIKIKANEQMMKHREDIKQLLNLLQIAYNERDEAREQLQKLLNKLMPSNPEFPVLVPTKANSSITESNSLSENHNYYPHNSSPEFSSLNQDFPQISTQSDPAIDIIDAIASGKPLPENGKFLQAVVEAGPLLQTLLVAGPLPRWRNPPLLHQPYKLPPVSLNQNVTPDLSMSRSHCSTSMLNFSSSGPALGGGAKFASGSGVSTQMQNVKRPRIV